MSNNADPVTGEIPSQEPHQENPKAATSFARFLQTLEDGQLNNELSEALQALSKEMHDYSLNYGSRAKGKVNISIDFIYEKGVFDIRSTFKVTNPIAPRIRSIAWSDRNHNLLPDNPRQNDMFRDVSIKTIKRV